MENNIRAICFTLVCISIVGSIGWYFINDRTLMSRNISEAVAKGMDPLAVRCSFAHSLDTTCVVYAATVKK
jgi:hypothetical protein